MYRSHTIEIKPNSHMRNYFEQCFGYSRYIYNKCINLFQEFRKEIDRFPTKSEIKCMIDNTQLNWELSMPSNIRNIKVNDFYISIIKWSKKVSNFPKFKSKKLSNRSFIIGLDNRRTFINTTKFKIDMGRKCTIDKKFRWIKMTENIKFKGSVKSITIYRKINKYFANFVVELDQSEIDKIEQKKPKQTNTIVGLDLGVKNFIVDSNGYEIQLPKKRLKKLEHNIKYYQKSLSSKIKSKTTDSKRFAKTKTKLQKCWMKAINIRNDFNHKLSSYYAQNFENIVIEDLQVIELYKNAILTKSIQDASFYNFRQKLEYKASKLIIADKYFPSTQTCSHCNFVKIGLNKLTLKDRIYKCDECGNELGRDLNAAINLKAYGERFIARL